MNRSIRITNDGKVWRSADTWTSLDKKKHSVRVTYSNNVSKSNPLGNTGFRFTTAGAYSASSVGSTPASSFHGSSANVAVLGVIVNKSLAPGYDNPVGDLVMSPRPSGVRFFSSSDRYWYPRWTISVPAKKTSKPIKQAYTIAASNSDLTKLRAVAIAGLAK